MNLQAGLICHLFPLSSFSLGLLWWAKLYLEKKKILSHFPIPPVIFFFEAAPMLPPHLICLAAGVDDLNWILGYHRASLDDRLRLSLDSGL